MNSSVKLLAVFLGLLAVSDAAAAADLSLPAAAPAIYNWTGLYIGLNVGYASANLSETVSGGGGSGSAGVEAAITDNLSARVEYLYVDTGNFDVAQVGPPFASVTGRLQDNLVRAGVNYRLPVAW
jgi:opacity protein-like surface antigen